MAVDLVDSATTGYTRTSFFSAASNAFTISAWVRPDNLPTVGSPYDVIGGMRNSIGMQLFWDGAAASWGIGTELSDFDGATSVTEGAWAYLCMIRNGNTKTLYLNGIQEATGSDAAAGSTELIIGSFNFGSAAENWDGGLAAVKVWDGAALTQDEIKTEMHSFLPRRFANLRAFYPMRDVGEDQTDFYTGGLTLTVTGTPATTADGPRIPYARRRRRPVVYTATVIPPWEPQQNAPETIHALYPARW